MPERVERAFRQWNLILRDYMRNETALRLSVGEESQTVVVRIVAGVPRPMLEVVRGQEAEVWLLLHRPLIEKTRDGLTAVLRAWNRPLPTWTPGLKLSFTPSEDETRNTLEYVRRLAELGNELELLKRFAKIDQDILGAYFFRAPRPCIELYWMSIGLFAAAIGVSPEALTVVVATHELAHAYTHLGRDIDSHQWDTRAFARSDIALVEGLAQFYTQVICDQLKPRMPEARVAFDRLLDLQAPAYKAHKGWAKDLPNAGEIVRVSMIQARATRVTYYPHFQDVLDAQAGQLSGPAG
jgi:hypothetical protein